MRIKNYKIKNCVYRYQCDISVHVYTVEYLNQVKQWFSKTFIISL